MSYIPTPFEFEVTRYAQAVRSRVLTALEVRPHTATELAEAADAPVDLVLSILEGTGGLLDTAVAVRLRGGSYALAPRFAA